MLLKFYNFSLSKRTLNSFWSVGCFSKSAVHEWPRIWDWGVGPPDLDPLVLMLVHPIPEGPEAPPPQLQNRGCYLQQHQCVQFQLPAWSRVAEKSPSRWVPAISFMLLLLIRSILLSLRCRVIGVGDESRVIRSILTPDPFRFFVVGARKMWLTSLVILVVHCFANVPCSYGSFGIESKRHLICRVQAAYLGPQKDIGSLLCIRNWTALQCDVYVRFLFSVNGLTQSDGTICIWKWGLTNY